MTTTDRARRHRERQRIGLGVLRVEADLNAFTEAAIDNGLLAENDDSRESLERVASEVLAGWQRIARKP